MRDIIVDEVELSISANNIQRNIDRLLDVMSEYNKILANLQKSGIQDNAISAQFSEIAKEISFCGRHLKSNIGTMGTTVNRGIERVEQADAFKFPNTSLFDTLKQMLSMV